MGNLNIVQGISYHIYRNAINIAVYQQKNSIQHNIEVKIDVTDKCSSFIQAFHAREEDKVILDKEMKRLCYFSILKEGFSSYSNPVMLISRKLTQDKRVMTDFRHLNMRIAKNNLSYTLLKDMFILLGSSKCEVISLS